VALYHLTLGGQGLMVDLQTYKRSLATLFAGKLHDGSLSLDDLLLEGALVMSDWSGGEGQAEAAINAAAYLNGSGLDGATVPGALRVGPALIQSFGSTDTQLRLLRAFKGKLLVSGSSGKVYEASALDTWAQDVDLAKAAGVTAFGTRGGQLSAGNGSDNIVATYDGTTWTAAGYTATGLTSIGLNAMMTFDQTTPTLLVGGPGALVGEIHRWNGATFSAALYLVQEPTVGQFAVLGYNVGYVVGIDAASRRSRIYRISGTTWDLGPEIPDNYPTSVAVWNGKIYYGMAFGGELWSFDGSSLVLVGKDLGASGDPLYGLTEWRGALWISTRNGTEVRLKRYDGASFSEPIGGGVLTNGLDNARGLLAFGGDLYVATGATGASKLYRSRSTVFPTAAKSLISSTYALEAAALAKLFLSVTITHAPLLASQSVQVEYQLDNSGIWINLGTNSTVGSAGTTLAFSGTVTGKLIAFRISLLATASASPTLSELKLTYVPPVGSADSATKRQWQFEALFEGTAELPLVLLDQTPSAQTGAQISTAIWSLFTAAGRPPVPFVDLDGVSRAVYLVDLEEKPSQESQRRGYQTRGKLKLVEA
jgi:hypothetical protein